MQTLQEFIRFTKGWEYIIAIVGILAFLAFWQFLGGSLFKKKSDAGKEQSSPGNGRDREGTAG